MIKMLLCSILGHKKGVKILSRTKYSFHMCKRCKVVYAKEIQSTKKRAQEK